MILTEAEAKTKWCPFGRFLAEVRVNRTTVAAAAVNTAGANDIRGQATSICIGSHCMAWRWAMKRNPDWKQSGIGGYPLPHPDDTSPPYIEDRERGYCGLAGRL
jgi:hypothetical protein